MKISYTSISGKGGRMNNEDCRNVVNIGDERKMFIVCDGMGGHAFGEVASKTVCDSISAYWKAHSQEKDGGSKIYRATKEAQKALDEKSGINQMGTIMVMMSIEGQSATIAHAGDSRCYIIDLKGNVKYRTIDHIETGTARIPYISTGHSSLVIQSRPFLKSSRLTSNRVTGYCSALMDCIMLLTMRDCFIRYSVQKILNRLRRNMIQSAVKRPMTTILQLL